MTILESRLPRSFAKALVWMFCIVTVGCVQIGIILFLSLFSNAVGLNFIKIIEEGFLLLLGISIVFSVCYEFYMEAKIKANRYLHVAIVIVTFGIILVAMGSYAIAYLSNALNSTLNFNFEVFQNIQMFLFVSSICWTVILKTAIYYESYLNSKTIKKS
ncbi:hypothetical protein H8S90_21210 [Olivibacter sp. SDN3]|uniref:hypothetical protein n=1 Tax=Olivibacter sp. SDN3 TaxID=2764720 RepID=UPI0016514E8D|nr:hypothetical protein [Olivibacter sp. SDN3]QNL49231.1 hypothetical protein H8S90_21210 [Olivibacter sp. SDN3]